MGTGAFVLGWNSLKKTITVFPGPDGRDLVCLLES